MQEGGLAGELAQPRTASGNPVFGAQGVGGGPRGIGWVGVSCWLVCFACASCGHLPTSVTLSPWQRYFCCLTFHSIRSHFVSSHIMWFCPMYRCHFPSQSMLPYRSFLVFSFRMEEVRGIHPAWKWAEQMRWEIKPLQISDSSTLGFWRS